MRGERGEGKGEKGEGGIREGGEGENGKERREGRREREECEHVRVRVCVLYHMLGNLKPPINARQPCYMLYYGNLSDRTTDLFQIDQIQIT